MWLKGISAILLIIAVTGAAQQREVVIVEKPYILVNEKPVLGSTVEMDPKKTTKFTCIADHGDPPPYVGWRLDGEDLKYSKNYTKKDRYPSNLYFVHIEVNIMPNITHHDKKLECIAYSENYEHNKTASVILKVEHAATEVHIVSPLFFIANVGNEVEMSCTSNGYPQPHFSWLKRLLSVDESVSDKWITVYKGKTMKVGKSPKDSGSYTCRAHNENPPMIIDSLESAEIYINGANMISSYGISWILIGTAIQLLLNKI